MRGFDPEGSRSRADIAGQRLRVGRALSVEIVFKDNQERQLPL